MESLPATLWTGWNRLWHPSFLTFTRHLPCLTDSQNSPALSDNICVPAALMSHSCLEGGAKVKMERTLLFLGRAHLSWAPFPSKLKREQGSKNPNLVGTGGTGWGWGWGTVGDWWIPTLRESNMAHCSRVCTFHWAISTCLSARHFIFPDGHCPKHTDFSKRRRHLLRWAFDSPLPPSNQNFSMPASLLSHTAGVQSLFLTHLPD